MRKARLPFERKFPTEDNRRGFTIGHTRSGGEEMDIYQLDCILHEPEENEGWMYLAEVPTLQGCMAWGIPPKRP